MSESSFSGLPSRGRGPGLATTVLVSALTSAAVSVATVTLMGQAGSPAGGEGGAAGAAPTGETVDVPTVANMPPDTARELLKGRGLLMVIQGERPDPAVPAGWIVEQTPMAGSQVRRGTEVTAKVSSGPERIAVPEVVGRLVADARQAIEGAGLRLGPVQETGSGTPGTVTATTPAPGTRVAPGSEVVLTAVPQAAAAPAEVEIPATRRMSSADARRALEAVGLRVGRTRQAYDDNLPGGRVIRTDPPAGQKVAPGTEVGLVVNESD
jgi:serine/threonine-protein kinase